jgi:predicted porin
LFGRQAYVSLASATWGEFRLGRQYTFNDEVNVFNNPFSNNLLLYPGYYSSTGGISPATRTNRLVLFVDSPRIDNAAQYLSPSFGGFRAQFMVAAGEGTPNGQPGAAVSVVPRYEAVKGSYVQGPVSAAVSYEQNRVSGVGTSNKVWTVAANYNFGRVKIMGGYQDAKRLTSYGLAYYGFPTNPSLNIVPANSATAAFPLDSLKAATIGVAVPVGNMTLGANYIRVKYENAPGTLDATLGKFGIGALYSLSKTTSLYAAASMSTGDLKDSIQEKRAYQVGLRKVF